MKAKTYKVFSGKNYSYCYDKNSALQQRIYMQSLGLVKVYIKGRL